MQKNMMISNTAQQSTKTFRKIFFYEEEKNK